MTLVPQWSFIPSFGFALPEPSYCRLNSSSNQSRVRIKSCKSWELILSFIQTVLPSFAHFTSHTQIGDETGLYSIKQRRSHLRSGQCLKLKPCNFEKSPCEYHNSKL
jgi:hypothetical protein